MVTFVPKTMETDETIKKRIDTVLKWSAK